MVKLGTRWHRAFIAPLKKAVGVYVDHQAIKGVNQDEFVDPSRILNSRFVFKNKGKP